MAKEFIITEGDIDSTLDMLLESPVNPYKKEITAITMGKFLARNPLSKRPRKGNPAFAGALPPKQRNRKEFTEEQSRSVCAELTKFKEFVKLRGPNSNIPQEKFSAKEVRKLLQFIDARIDRFGFCDVKEEGECTDGRVKNDEGECKCPPGYHWVPYASVEFTPDDSPRPPSRTLEEVEGETIPPDATGKCVEDEKGPLKRVDADVEIHDMSKDAARGYTSVVDDFTYKGEISDKITKLQLAENAKKFLEMHLVGIIIDAILVSAKSPKKFDLETFFQKLVLPRLEASTKGLNNTLKSMKRSAPDDKIAKAAFEKTTKQLKDKKQTLESNPKLTKKFNEIKEAVLSTLVDYFYKSYEPDPENKEKETLTEEKLLEITIDFSEIRRKNQHLDESFLVMFGGWVKWLLGKMFGGGQIPGTIKGSRGEVESFARAMASEKSYIQTAQRYGLDHPTTYKSKSKLSSATSGFEKETGIKWPFE